MRKINTIIITTAMLLGCLTLSAQVAINTDGSSANASAMLDIKSTDKGFLPPRMVSDEIKAISTPAEGLIVYDTDLNKPVYHDGDEWRCFDGATAYQPEVGDFYRGGVVFYIFQISDPGYVEGEIHGLICALSDQDGGSGIQWYNGVNIETGASATALGTGQTNTNTINNTQGAGSYAASVCDNYTFGSYSDWFLPSKEEILKMFVDYQMIDATAIINGGSSFAPAMYWSSSEIGSSAALNYDRGQGESVYLKYSLYRVRAVRVF